MSVVAFRDGTLAADSLITGESESQYLGHMHKIIRTDDNRLIGAVGDVKSIQKFFGWIVEDPDLSGKLPKFIAEIDAIEVVAPKCVYLWSGRNRIEVSASPFLAIGHGREYALGAMAFGASSVQAVGIACDYVPSCGPPVESMTWVEVLSPTPNHRTRQRPV